MREHNVIISKTMLGMEDHGVFTSMLTLSGDGWGVGFGGWVLDTFDGEVTRRRGTAFGMEYIKRLLLTLEVESWEQLRGTKCRVRFDSDEPWGGKVVAIGHWNKDALWFEPRALAKEYAMPVSDEEATP